MSLINRNVNTHTMEPAPKKRCIQRTLHFAPSKKPTAEPDSTTHSTAEESSSSDGTASCPPPPLGVITTATTTNASVTKKSGCTRLYRDDYIQFGFTFTGDTSFPIPFCIVCGDKLANSAMVPSKLKRHLETHHEELARKDRNFFVALKTKKGRNENILTSTAKLNAFRLKLAIWRKAVRKGDLSAFPCSSGYKNNPDLCGLISEHLETLEEKFAFYFPPPLPIDDYTWVCNPMKRKNENSPMLEQAQLVDIQSDYRFERKFDQLSLDRFWLTVGKEYPAITDSAMQVLLPFSTTYLCELGFSSLTAIKTKHRERLRAVDEELRVSLSSVTARIKPLCAGKQAQGSH